MLVYYVLWIFTWLWTVANQIQKNWVKIDYIFLPPKEPKKKTSLFMKSPNANGRNILQVWESLKICEKRF